MTDTLKILTHHDWDVASQIALALAGTERRGAAGPAVGFLRIGYLNSRGPVAAVLAACGASVADATDAARHCESGWGVTTETLDRLDAVLSALQQWLAAGAGLGGGACSTALADCRTCVTAERAELALADAHASRLAARIAKVTAALALHGIAVAVHPNNLMTVTHRDGSGAHRRTIGQVEQLAATLTDSTGVAA